MSIIRAPRPAENFYLLDKRISENSSLSWAARGLLIFILGKPDSWKVSVAHLRKQTLSARVRTGRDGVYALLKELEARGYLRTEQKRSADGRGFGEIDYIVSESVYPGQADTRDADTPDADTPEPTLVRIERATRIEGEQPIAQRSALRFAEFWAVYPKRVGKKKSLAKWKAKGLDSQADTIISDVQRRSTEDGRWLDGFIPDPLTYLDGERWEDELQPRRERRDGKPRKSLAERGAEIHRFADERERQAIQYETPTPPRQPETRLQNAIEYIRHQHAIGALGDGPKAAAARDRMIDEARAKYAAGAGEVLSCIA